MGLALRRQIEALIPDALDPFSTWFKPWYFHVRLEEALRRFDVANRASVIAVELRSAGPDFGQELRRRLLSLDEKVLDRASVPCACGRRQLMVLMSGRSREQVEAAAGNIVDELADFGPAVGVAAWPEDGTTADDLIAWATRYHYLHLAEIVDLTEYRARGASRVSQLRPVEEMYWL
jgi:hypothetical protein